jgi:hypothetical protein
MKIINAGQVVSLEGASAGQILCQFTVVMSDGRKEIVHTNEETIGRIIDLFSRPPKMEPPPNEVRIDEGVPPLLGTLVGEIDMPSPAPAEIGSRRKPAPRRAIGVDEMGYPIVPGGGATQAPLIEDEEDAGERQM